MPTRRDLPARATARRLGIRTSTLTAWNESGVGPLPDDRGRYAPDTVTQWADEMSAAGSTV